MKGGMGMRLIDNAEDARKAFEKFITNSTGPKNEMRGSYGTLYTYENKTDEIYYSTDIDTDGDVIQTILA